MHTQRTELAYRIGKLAHTLEAVGDEPTLIIPLIDDVSTTLPECYLTEWEETQVTVYLDEVASNPSERTLPIRGKGIARILHVRG